MKTRLIIVGGFLGAGKTTLLWESIRKLSERGIKAGLITNDQAAESVDTAFLKYANGDVEEVSGSCFCCNFNGFTNAISRISKEKGYELILAEPVGSCTDLSATIIQPLKEKFGDSVIMAPLTVLADPNRLSDILKGGTSGLHESAAYIYRKQLEEADTILINKTDLLRPAELESLVSKVKKQWPQAYVASISAKTGSGLHEWLNYIMTHTESGTHLAEVDYNTYAEGEAVLGWLNASVELAGKNFDGDLFLINYIDALSQRIERMGSAVGHVKLLIQKDMDHAICSLTGKTETIRVRGYVGTGNHARLTINARVQMPPEKLKSVILNELEDCCEQNMQFKVLAINCLSPGRPTPTYRYNYTL
jgi:G3E family GTPase